MLRRSLEARFGALERRISPHACGVDDVSPAHGLLRDDARPARDAHEHVRTQPRVVLLREAPTEEYRHVDTVLVLPDLHAVQVVRHAVDVLDAKGSIVGADVDALPAPR